MKTYNHNKRKKNYTVYLKDGEDLTINESKHREILIDYIVREMPVQQLCHKHGVTQDQFSEYRQAFGITRKSLPLIDEEILNNPDTNDLAKTLLERTQGILKEAAEIEFEILSENAQKWLDFKNGKLDPFEKAISKWQPKKVAFPKATKKGCQNGQWFCIGFSDWQIGSKAEGRYLYRQEDWNSDKAKEAISKLLFKISRFVDSQKQGYEGCCLVLGGDLLHGITGSTSKGTKLDVDYIGEEQFDFLMDILYNVIDQISKKFPKVVIHSVRGNHEGYDHYPIMIALKNYFSKNKKIKFNIHSSRTAAFKIHDTMVLLDHGASDVYRADVPKNGKSRESYIQSLILTNSELYSKCNGCVFLQGDKHHYEQIEFNDFEFIMMGALPLGDRYADNNNWHSRARQNCFVIGPQGLHEVIHFYV